MCGNVGLAVGPLMDLRKEGIIVNQPFDDQSGLNGYVIMKVHVNGVSGTRWPLLLENHQSLHIESP